MIGFRSSGEICRNSSECEGPEPVSQSRATYSQRKCWKIKPEFCLRPYGKVVFDPGICTDLLVSATQKMPPWPTGAAGGTQMEGWGDRVQGWLWASQARYQLSV